MKNLLNLSMLSKEEILTILDDAKKFKQGMKYSLEDKIIVNLFFESSTRTHYSFVVAEEKLGMKIINFDPASSSLVKGESFYDTIKTFTSFGVDALVIRHSENAFYQQLENISTPIINAGDGTGDHPSQTLLDLMTIHEEFGTFENIKIAIIGDIMHSRVAHSNVKVMERLGMKCYYSGPLEYIDDKSKYIEFDNAIKEMDIVMMLRIQNERHNKKLNFSNEEYLEKYGLTLEKIKQMKPQSIIMHPAPVNRGVELADDVVECSKSRIFKQIENGVFVRQSILKRTFS